MNEDIIVAIATSRLEAAISMIRVSGPDCIAFVQKFFTGKIIEKPSHTINYGYIIDDGKRIDEVLVNIYRGTRTFTGEEMVEINCHGGVYITSRVLEVCIKNGARMAERGEFSKRAFLNGRIDLSQAEAISDIITAKNSYATDLALKGISGSISGFIEDLKEDLIQIITQIEVNIDYPEYDDVEELTASSLLPRSANLLTKMNKILDDSKNIKLVKEGIKTVIIGRPNVGKSSLLNALLREDKAIVTNIAGTTRDIVEGSISIDGVVLNMIDTAGIRETEDIVEQIGVDRAKEYAEKADLILFVVDASSPLDDNDYEILKIIRGKQAIVLLNKSDLDMIVSKNMIQTLYNESNLAKKENKEMQEIPIIEVSAKKNHGIDEFETVLKDMFFAGNLSFNDEIYITNIRHKTALQDAYHALSRVNDSIDAGMPEDFYSIDLLDAYESLGSITGETIGEDLVNEIFSKFCMGK